MNLYNITVNIYRSIDNHDRKNHFFEYCRGIYKNFNFAPRKQQKNHSGQVPLIRDKLMNQRTCPYEPFEYFSVFSFVSKIKVVTLQTNISICAYGSVI